jgi:hypothetical protein
MIKLANLLAESTNLFKIDVLIKTVADVNKVEVYNQIRAIEGVVVMTIEQSEYLDSKATDKFEYSLLHIKYLVTADPKIDINRIKEQALITTKIPGLLQFIPRYQTSHQLGKY